MSLETETQPIPLSIRPPNDSLQNLFYEALKTVPIDPTAGTLDFVAEGIPSPSDYGYSTYLESHRSYDSECLAKGIMPHSSFIVKAKEGLFVPERVGIYSDELNCDNLEGLLGLLEAGGKVHNVSIISDFFPFRLFINTRLESLMRNRYFVDHANLHLGATSRSWQGYNDVAQLMMISKGKHTGLYLYLKEGSSSDKLEELTRWFRGLKAKYVASHS